MTAAALTAMAGEGALPVLDVSGLTVAFHLEGGQLPVVRAVDITLLQGEVLGLVGESGSGKSLLARAILGILPPQASIVSGTVSFAGTNLVDLTQRQITRLRGDRMALVPQEPMTSLNPALRIGRQLSEVLEVHRPEMGRAERRARAVDVLNLVGIKFPAERLAQYPHELSGGLRQRVAIAMALICGRVELLIADEPTTALDVTIQAQILDLFLRLQSLHRMGLLLITHDLGIVAQTAQRVAVMYAGEIVEVAEVQELFSAPGHPYTRGLLNSLPRLGGTVRKSHLPTIPGTVPSPSALGIGCAFVGRCAFGLARCQSEAPQLLMRGPSHAVRCHRAKELAGHLAESHLHG
jgi:peptide/nickel transport system ATP-binding protein